MELQHFPPCQLSQGCVLVTTFKIYTIAMPSTLEGITELHIWACISYHSHDYI